ncbi:hypothetical protein D3C76_1566680 [compost metagenome]
MESRGKKKFVIYSLGNFVSTKLMNIPYTQSGIILNLTIQKDPKGHTNITSVNYIPTGVDRRMTSGGRITEIVPLRDVLKPGVSDRTGRRNNLNRMLNHTESILKREKSRH